MVPTGRRLAPPDDRLRTRPQMRNLRIGESRDSGFARSLSSGRALRGPVGAPRNDGLVLLHHKFRRLCLEALLPQQGHRGRVLMSALIKRKRMVAIEFGMWRSGRKGGSPGSITVG